MEVIHSMKLNQGAKQSLKWTIMDSVLRNLMQPVNLKVFVSQYRLTLILNPPIINSKWLRNSSSSSYIRRDPLMKDQLKTAIPSVNKLHSKQTSLTTLMLAITHLLNYRE